MPNFRHLRHRPGDCSAELKKLDFLEMLGLMHLPVVKDLPSPEGKWEVTELIGKFSLIVVKKKKSAEIPNLNIAAVVQYHNSHSKTVVIAFKLMSFAIIIAVQILITQLGSLE